MGLRSLHYWQDRAVLVTGATGLLGGWLVRFLLKAEAAVVVLVRDWVPQSEVLQPRELGRVTLVRGDIADQKIIERTLGEYEISNVFHLAAQTLVPIANRNPTSTFETNIAGTWCLLEACRRNPKVKQIIVASSDKAYGAYADLPYREETPLKGRYPYDVSKSCADLIAQSYAGTFNLPVIVARCSNIFGGGDLNWNRLIPGSIRSVIRGQRPVIRSDGTPLRDYIYVEDALEAYIRLAEKFSDDPSLLGEAFNISADQPFSASDMVDQIIETLGSNLEPEILNEALHEIPEQYLSSAKLRSTTGWFPETGLKEGLLRTVDWYRSYFNNQSDRAQ